MVRIRLRRVGAKKQPSYRIVVTDSRSPRNGRFIETIGHYNPRTEPPTVVIQHDRAAYWLQHGAQPSEAVARLLRKQGHFAADQPVSAVGGASETAGPVAEDMTAGEAPAESG